MTVKPNISLSDFAFTSGGSISLGKGSGDLALESAEDQLSIMSDFNITRDAAGLALARDMVDVLLGAIAKMKEDQKKGLLPDVLTEKKPTVRANPLA